MRARGPDQTRSAPAFAGFEAADYRVFETSRFAEGMAALRARITPKLVGLGAVLAPRLAAATGEPFFAHVAKHARRTVNTPPETWVAFGRDRKRYKAFAYLGVVVHRRGVDARLVLKDESTDKGTLAAALVRERDRLADLFAAVRGIAWYLPVPGRLPRVPAPPIQVGRLPEGFWGDLAGALRTRKSAAVEIGFGWPAADRRLASPEFERVVLRGLVTLFPLYRLATRRGARLDPGREASET